MGNSHLLFQSLFKRDFFANDSKTFLTNLTKEHPYFTAAHFFLLKETAIENEGYESVAATTSLLFNNLFWLNYQLDYSFYDESEPIKLLDTGLNKTEFIEDETNKKTFETTEVDGIISVTTQATEIVEALVTEQNVPVELEEKALIIEPVPEILLPVKLLTESNEVNLPKFVFIKDEEKGMEDFTEEDFEEEIEDKEIEPMNFKLNFTNINTTEDTISFEPLHVSDYFTSVGIKLTDEVKPGDKLGKQLKSFTDWLKTMKKVHVVHLKEEIAENNDIIIQQMAEKSNKEGETLTEAMAEVLLQQGMRVKAIEVYQKLSLLYPVKSAYFANKISQIHR